MIRDDFKYLSSKSDTIVDTMASNTLLKAYLILKRA